MKDSIMHETKTHGKLSFPYIVYRGNIPEYMHSYPLHWHDEMEIIYVTGGSGIVTIQSVKYTVHGGDILIIPPQIVHSIEELAGSNMEYFNILFQFSLLTNGTNDNCYEKYFKSIYEHTKTVPLYLPANENLNRLLLPSITDLTENRKLSYTQYELMVKSDLFAIMHHLIQYSTEVSSMEHSLQTTYDKLKKLFLYIQSNYNKSISVSKAAHICGFSASHFMKLFKELTGQSFSQYLKNYRLEMAASLLVESQQKIIEISEQTGFHNHSYFTRSFIAKYGISPSMYRKNSQLSPISIPLSR